MGRISFLVCQSLAFLYGSMQKERVGNMKKSKTGKWSILLAAFVLTTGLSGVIQAADYTQGLTGVVGEDPITVCNGKSMILSFKIIGHGVTFLVKADGISRPHE